MSERAAKHAGPSGAFNGAVYGMVRDVPKGFVTTYGTIARALGRPRAARLVGWALHRCPDDVPAHRVVNRDGDLSGGWAFGSPAVQQALLEAEGVAFERAGRCVLERHYWDPRPADP